MRRYRPLPAVVFAILVSALVGGLFGRNALATDDKVPEHYKHVHRGAERDRDELRRQGRFRQPRLRRRARHARHARSAFELLRARRSTRRCASGRKAATTASASRFRRSTATSPRCSVFEGIARLQEGHPPRRRASPTIDGEDAKGWTIDQAMRKLRGPKGTDVERRASSGRGYEQLIQFDADARRSLHPDRAGVLHDRRDDRLHPACRTSARTPIAT